MKPSIKKISEMTGFSPATISKALNHKKGINKETSETIFKAAEEIGYRMYSPITCIHMIFFETTGTFMGAISFRQLFLDGVESVAKENDLEVKVSYLSRNDALLKARIDRILNERSSAILLLGTEMYEEDYQLFARPEGFVFVVDGSSDIMPFPSVSLNNVGMTQAAVRYLLQKGHTKIGYLRANERIRAFQEREIGIRRELEAHGLELKNEFIISLPSDKEHRLQLLKNYFANNNELPTAFIADCEIFAGIAINVMKECSIRIPDDVSLISIDDVLLTGLVLPPLTTFRTPLRDLGIIATEMIIDYIQGKYSVSMHVLVDSELIERESVSSI